MRADRRQSERLAGPFETLVRLPHLFGPKREIAAVVENLCVGGALMHTTGTISPGAQVFVVFRLSTTGHAGPHVAARGRVVRSERQSNGSVGIAVQFSSHRFL